MVVPLSVEGFMSSLNVTAMMESFGKFIRPFTGAVRMTVGGVVSLMVVNVHVDWAASWFPARSLTPVVTVAV